MTFPKWAVGLTLASGIGLFVVGVESLVVGMGCALLALGADQIQRQRRSRTWPSTLAVVVDREIREATGTLSSPSSSAVRLSYTPVARYEYTVEGTVYTGVSLEDGATAMDSLDDAVRMTREQWGLGQTVPVWYDPAHPFVHTRRHPDTSRPRLSTWMLLVSGLALAAGGVVWIATGGF